MFVCNSQLSKFERMLFFFLSLHINERHYYMKDVNIVVPDPSKEKSVLAVSAIAREMKQTNKVAIVRCVWRNGQGNVVVGVLTPNVSERDDTVSYSFLCSQEYFYLNLTILTIIYLFLSLILFTSTCYLLPRISASFHFLLSTSFLHHGSQMNNSKQQQIIWLRCLTLHLLLKRKY